MGQNLAHSFYTGEKTCYPLIFRLYEQDAETRFELAQEMVVEVEQQVGIPVKTYLFDSRYTAADL